MCNDPLMVWSILFPRLGMNYVWTPLLRRGATAEDLKITKFHRVTMSYVFFCPFDLTLPNFLSLYSNSSCYKLHLYCCWTVLLWQRHSFPVMFLIIKLWMTILRRIVAFYLPSC